MDEARRSVICTLLQSAIPIIDVDEDGLYLSRTRELRLETARFLEDLVELQAMISTEELVLNAVGALSFGYALCHDLRLNEYVAHIRDKETDRIGDLARELRKLGAAVDEFHDGLTIRPTPLHGATLDTYDDHRMAMSMALVGLAVTWMIITRGELVIQ